MDKNFRNSAGRGGEPQFIKMFQKQCKKYRICESIARRLIGTITHVSIKDPIAALTFDDGPHPEFTPLLLEVLKNHKARGTFFMIGEAAERYPHLVKRIAEEQHAIANHTYSHTPFFLLDGSERRKQIIRCQKAIVPYGIKLLRPPHGYQTFASRIDALFLGYKVVAWNVDVQDWANQDIKSIVDQLLDKIQPGSIVLLHDSLHVASEECFKDRSSLLEAVDIFLDKIGFEYQFVTLPELFQRGKAVKQNWYRGPDIIT